MTFQRDQEIEAQRDWEPAVPPIATEVTQFEISHFPNPIRGDQKLDFFHTLRRTQQPTMPVVAPELCRTVLLYETIRKCVRFGEISAEYDALSMSPSE